MNAIILQCCVAHQNICTTFTIVLTRYSAIITSF